MKTIEMAREAGFMVVHEGEPETGAWYECFTANIEDFAELIRADEREIWAKDANWCIQNHLEHLIPERIRARGNT